MGRDSAYAGKAVTWDGLLASTARLGPAQYAMGPVSIKPSVPMPGVDPGPTVSVGVVSYPADGRSADALLVSADRAMYASKRGGKNRVARATAEPTMLAIEPHLEAKTASDPKAPRESERAG